MKLHYHTTNHHRLSHHSPWHNCRRPNHRCPPNGFMTWLCAGLVVHASNYTYVLACIYAQRLTSWFSLFQLLSPCFLLTPFFRLPSRSAWLCTRHTRTTGCAPHASSYKCNNVLACMYSHQLTSGFCLFPFSQSSTFQPGLGQLPGAAAQKCPGLLLRVLLPQICCCFGSYIRLISDIDMCWFNHHRLLHHSPWHNCRRHPSGAARPFVQ